METAVEQVMKETEPKSSFSFTHSNDETDSFIEIQLEPVRLGYGDDDDDDDKVAGDDESEMRISFSSALVALPDVFSIDESFEKLPPRSPLFSSSLSEWSFSSSAPLSYQKKQRTNENRVRLPTMSSGKFSEMGHKPARQIDVCNSNYNYREFSQSRGSSSSSSSSSRCKCNNGRMVKGGLIMKIWMKLRSKNLGALVEWLVKVNSEGGGGLSKKKSSVGDGFNRCLVQKERSGGWSRKSSGGWSRKSSGDQLRAKSCPVSSKASPLHREAKLLAGECSIQAAIAHCKRSYAEH